MGNDLYLDRIDAFPIYNTYTWLFHGPRITSTPGSDVNVLACLENVPWDLVGYNTGWARVIRMAE